MAQAARQNPGLPRYLEIAAVIRREIATGYWTLGNRLPPMTELAKRFAVAPLTARQAVKYLEGRGIVECRRGAGTYVSGPLLQLQSLPLRSDLREVVDQIELGELVNLPMPATHASPEIPPGLQSAAEYHGFYRLFLLDDQPALVSETFIDREIYDQAPEAFDTDPVLPLVLKRHGEEIERERNWMTVEMADSETAAHLQLAPFAPIAQLRLVLKNSRNVAVYVGTLMFPAELIRVEFDN